MQCKAERKDNPDDDGHSLIFRITLNEPQRIHTLVKHRIYCEVTAVHYVVIGCGVIIVPLILLLVGLQLASRKGYYLTSAR